MGLFCIGFRVRVWILFGFCCALLGCLVVLVGERVSWGFGVGLLYVGTWVGLGVWCWAFCLGFWQRVLWLC